MRQRTVYVSHSDAGPTWVSITESQPGKIRAKRRHEYEPGKASCNRLERLLSTYQPGHANLSRFHVSVTWNLEGKVSYYPDFSPADFYPSPEELPFEDEPERCKRCGAVADDNLFGLCDECRYSYLSEPEHCLNCGHVGDAFMGLCDDCRFTESLKEEVERCYSCGKQAEYLYEGMCATCNNADMDVEEFNHLHYERWLNGEE